MTEMWKLSSKYFGEIEYESGDVIHFEAGLFGFEEEQIGRASCRERV